MADAQKKKIDDLQAQVDEVSVLCRALMEALVKKKVLTRQEIKALRDEIDGADGAMDGRSTRLLKLPKGE
jgi:hypothetical protein